MEKPDQSHGEDGVDKVAHGKTECHLVTFSPTLS
jgi:hypothetical protein